MDTTEVLCTCPARSLQVGVNGGEGSTGDHWGQSKKDIGDTSRPSELLRDALYPTRSILFIYLFILLWVADSRPF